jgi:hypothetical protein
VIGECFLFITGSKTLIKELVVAPGEPFQNDKIIKIFGDYHAEEDPHLICEYFNGRKIVFREFKYSPKNLNGIDSCPAFLRPRQ